MNTHTDTSSFSSSASNPQSSRLVRKATLGKQISPQIVDALASFIRQTLSVEPHITAYRALWECAWMESAGELTVFLDGDGDERVLRVIYLEKDNDPPVGHLQPAEIQQLCQYLQAQTGLPARARA